MLTEIELRECECEAYQDATHQLLLKAIRNLKSNTEIALERAIYQEARCRYYKVMSEKYPSSTYFSAEGKAAEIKAASFLYEAVYTDSLA